VRLAEQLNPATLQSLATGARWCGNAVTAFLVVMLALGFGWDGCCCPTKPVGDFAMYVESAAHLVKFGSFDPEYVFMPGYVFLLAAVSPGRRWLACKLVAQWQAAWLGRGLRIARRCGKADHSAGGWAALRPVASGRGHGQRDRHGHAGGGADCLGWYSCCAIFRHDPAGGGALRRVHGLGDLSPSHRPALSLLSVFCFRASGLGWKAAARNAVCRRSGRVALSLGPCATGSATAKPCQ